VSHSVLDDYRQRYPDKQHASWQVIENGYDEALFAPHDHLSARSPVRPDGQPVKLLHSGLLYPLGRNPLPFLKAVKELIENNQINLEVVFRGSGFKKEISEQINRLGLAQVVKILPTVSYDQAIQEMLQSDVLLVFQGAAFNKQIPAKLYEYLRAGRPILAMTDTGGETAKILRDWDGTYLANSESKDSIEYTLMNIIDDLKANKQLIRNPDQIKKVSRYVRTEQLNELLLSVLNKSQCKDLR
jgi:glycosyltransferase involved in cell wall biosynthesis